MQKKNASPTIFKLSEIQDEDTRMSLEMKYSDYKANKILFVEAQRKADLEVMKAKKLQVEAQIKMLEFINSVSEHSDIVQTEPFWFVYSRKGDILLENIFTEQDAQNAFRIQKKKFNKEVAEELGDDDDLYE